MRTKFLRVKISLTSWSFCFFRKYIAGSEGLQIFIGFAFYTKCDLERIDILNNVPFFNPGT